MMDHLTWKLVLFWVFLLSFYFCGAQEYKLRDYTIIPPVSIVERDHYALSIFPNFKLCKQLDYVNEDEIENRTLTWSMLVDLYLVPDSDIIPEKQLADLEKAYNTDLGHLQIRFGILIVTLISICLACAASLLIPIAGALLFVLVENVYKLATNKWIRKIGRRVFIEMELNRRKHEISLLNRSNIKKKPPRPKFRLPKFFRDYSDEDIPEILQAPHGQDIGSSDDEDDFDLEIAYAEVKQEEMRNLHNMLVKRALYKQKILEEAREKTKSKEYHVQVQRKHEKHKSITKSSGKNRKEFIKTEKKLRQFNLALKGEVEATEHEVKSKAEHARKKKHGD